MNEILVSSEASTVHRAGVFIVLEGIDGSGKTSMAIRLVDSLRRRGRQVHLTAEPSMGAIGRLIRQALRGETAVAISAMPALFAADRRHHAEVEIVPALKRGDLVICDRYSLSNVAYRAAEADGPLLWCCTCQWAGDEAPVVDLPERPMYCPRCQVNGVRFTQRALERAEWAKNLSLGVPEPNLTVVIDVPVELAAERRRARGSKAELFEVDRLQRRCAMVYRQASRFVSGPCAIIDGIGTEDDVATRMLVAVEGSLQRKLRPQA